MDIKALKTDWFFDDITPRGLSFDGFLPQACKTPLGNIQDFELIHSPKRMAEFQSNAWYERNQGLSEILTTVTPLETDKHILVGKYKKEMADILNLPCDLHEHEDGRTLTRGACRGFKTLEEDLSRYGDAVMTGDNEFDEGKLYDVKKEIYRLTDRVVSGLAKCFHIQASGAFDVIDELLEKGIISSAARDNLASASAIGLKLRISTYLKAGKQGEELKVKHTDTSVETTQRFHMPQDEELFHFFYVAIPLYHELARLFLYEKNFKSLSQDVLFDCANEVKANIYSRVLNYTKAIKCYDQALKTDSDNIDIAIRQMRLMLIINDDTESTRSKLECFLGKFFNVPYTKNNEDSLTDPEVDNILASVQDSVLRQLLEILMFLSSFQPSNWYFKLAEKLFDRCMAAENTKFSSKLHLLMTDFAFSHFYVNKISSWQSFYSSITELSGMIDSEGVSTKSICCLNKLAEIFTVQGNYNKSYKCLQRALTMERTLYGTNPNFIVMKTLYHLGMLSIQLFMFKEGQFYLEQLLQQFDSFVGLRPRLIHKQTYLQLAILYSGMDRCEEGISFLKKGMALTTDRKNAIEQNFDCIMHCELAKSWYSLKNNEETRKSVQIAKDYLSGIASTDSRVAMSCYVAMTFHELGLSGEGIALLNEEIQHVDIQSHPEKKAPCLLALGRICNRSHHTVEAETYYINALEIFTLQSNNSSLDDVLESLLEVSDVLVGNGKPLEGRKRLDDAQRLVSTMDDKHKKCNMLKEVGERWERFGEIHLAAKCYDQALRLCKDNTMFLTNIPFSEFSLEVNLGDLCGKGNVGERAKEYETYVTKDQRVAAQRKHYERAGSLLQRYCTRGNYDTLLIDLFLLLAKKYATIDVNEMEKQLLRALEINDVYYGSVTGNDTTSSILFHFFYCYFLKSEYTLATDAIERSLRIEMSQHSSDPFHPHICCRLVFFSGVLFLNLPASKDTGELLVEFFQSGLNGDEFNYSSVTVKANAAHCFTFLSLIFWSYHDHERARLLNGIALQLFEEIKDQKIPGNRSSSRIMCNKIEKILEQPNDQHAVVELFLYLTLNINSESNMYAFLDEHNTRDKLRNILNSIIPSFFHTKDGDMSSFLPRLISLYDQFSHQFDADLTPHLPFIIEYLRQVSGKIYGENPVTHNEPLSIDNIVELRSSAMNLFSSIFSNGASRASLVDQVTERVAQTNYGAVIDHSSDDRLTNAFNIASNFLANAGTSDNSCVLGSLLHAVGQPMLRNDTEAIAPSIQPKISIDSVPEGECSSRDLVLTTKCIQYSAESDKVDNDNVLIPKNVEEDKGNDSLAAINDENTVSLDHVKESKNITATSRPVYGRNVDVDSIKQTDNEFNPTSFALEISKYMTEKIFGMKIYEDSNNSPPPTRQLIDQAFKNVTAQVFGNVTGSSVGLINKGKGSSTSPDAQDKKDIAPACSSRQDEVMQDEGLSQGKTEIDHLYQEYQPPHSTQLSQLSGNLETLESYPRTIGHLQQKVDAMRTMIPVIQKLADSANEFLEKGEVEKYMEANDSLSSLIKSFVKLAPKNSVIEKLLTNAEEDMKNHKTKSAQSRLNLAAQFPRNYRQDARFSKMIADCDLLDGSYRLAAINFTRAANYYSSDRSQEPGDKLVYLKTLLGLIKALILCQKLQDAWQVCQDGVVVSTKLEPSKVTSLHTMKVCYLSAKCLVLSKVTGDDLNKAASFCLQGLAASKIVADDMSDSSDFIKSLGKNGEFLTIKCETQLLLATILLQLDKKEEANEILTDMQRFLMDVAFGFEAFTAITWEGGNSEFYKVSCRLFAWIGRAFVMNDQANSSICWLNKSLSAFVTSKRIDTVTQHEEFIPLLDAVAAANAAVFPDHNNSFQQAVEMYKRDILEQHGDVVTIYVFMCFLGIVYMDAQRTSEAIVVYETALAAAECMSDSLEDQRKRAFIQLHLGHAHRTHANNDTGKGRSEERALARKYYETGEDKDLHFTALCKKLSLACWLLEDDKFAEADVLIQQLLELGDKLVNIPVALGYSSRFFYGPAMKGYIEEHGRCMTTLVCLLCSVAVFVYAELGSTSVAVEFCETLSTQHDLRGILRTQPSVNSYVLAACHRKLSFLVNDRNLQNTVFPLSSMNLAKLYYELEQYELVLKYCLEILESVASSSSELESSKVNSLKLDCLHIVGNTLVQTGNHDKCYSCFTSFLEALHNQEQILDLEFEKQCAVLEEYSFADRFYIMRSLGILCARRGNPDCAIKCYEKCLEEDENLECHPDLVGTLAELYQSKALLAKNDQTVYSHWMKLAHDLYGRLFEKTKNPGPFVEASYGLFLCKFDRHSEAIDCFLRVIQNPADTIISFSDEDKPLLDTHLAREIEVRTTINLPLKVFAYHQLCTAYIEMGEIEKAQESARTLENYVSRFQSSSEYSLILSVVGYTYKLIGNKEKAVNVLVSVLENMPNHPPLTETLETYFMDLD